MLVNRSKMPHFCIPLPRPAVNHSWSAVPVSEKSPGELNAFLSPAGCVEVLCVLQQWSESPAAEDGVQTVECPAGLLKK